MSDARRNELLAELEHLFDYTMERAIYGADDKPRVGTEVLFIEGELDAAKMARVGAILTELSTLWPRVLMTGEKT